MKNMTVGELKKALEGVPDNMEVCVRANGMIDFDAEIYIESAERRGYGNEYDYFSIFVMERDFEEEEEEE